ncbi:transposase [Streptomyces sp. NBC_00140]|uniref:transposase n=1 Tax=Streptomyces sp. NBC_00140 TaxID=2975664 RepID=UPI00339034A4
MTVCPAEQTSVSWATTRSSRRTRIPLVQIRFDAATCRDCPLRSRCTTAGNGKWGQALTLREPAQRAALQQRRREQDTDAWRARYRLRAGIESTVCQIIHHRRQPHPHRRLAPRPPPRSHPHYRPMPLSRPPLEMRDQQRGPSGRRASQ